MQDQMPDTAEHKRYVHDDLIWEYVVCGEGDRVLVLLPGVLGGPHTMQRHIAAFCNDFRVIALSLPCFDDLDHFARSLENLLTRELAHDVILSGSSFGGLLAQAFLFRMPERLQGMILSDTGLPNRERGSVSRIACSVARFLPFPIARWLFLAKINTLFNYPVPAHKEEELAMRKDALQQWVQSHLKRKLLLNRLDLAAAFDSKEQLNIEAIRAWSGKMLITYTEDDPSRDEGLPMEQVYPSAEVFVFPDGGHLAQMVHFEKYVEVVRNFVASC